MENKDLETIGLLLVIATFMGFTGIIFSHFPQKSTEGGRNLKGVAVNSLTEGIPSEAFHRLALREGQKENEKGRR